jgi:hypothetical protein
MSDLVAGNSLRAKEKAPKSLTSLNTAFAQLVIPAKAGIHDGRRDRIYATIANVTLDFTDPHGYSSFWRKPEGSDLQPHQRVWQHKNDLADGFSKRYRIHTLVWYDLHGTMQSAIAREKDYQGVEARLED